MSTTSSPPKTVVEIFPATHERIKEAAKASGCSVKRFVSTILDYSLQKINSGEIILTEPQIEEQAIQKGAR